MKLCFIFKIALFSFLKTLNSILFSCENFKFGAIKVKFCYIVKGPNSFFLLKKRKSIAVNAMLFVCVQGSGDPNEC